RASRQHGQIKCFQCSWDAEMEVDEKRRLHFKDLMESEDTEGLQGPLRPPFVGVETFAESPSEDQLKLHCETCKKTDGTCARWTYYTSEQPRNVTWLCVNSVEIGCFVEKLPNQLRKEVCLCKDQDFCNGTGVPLPSPILAILLLLVGLGAAAR
ncbi:unnamed protein product, partial [Ixodes hexagonus]